MIDLDKDKNGAISFEEFVVPRRSGRQEHQRRPEDGNVKAKQALRGQVDQNRQDIRAGGGEPGPGTADPCRPCRALVRRKSRRLARIRGYPSPAPMSAGRMRPMSAIDRGTLAGSPSAGLAKRSPTARRAGGRSRMDYRPPSAGVQPRLHLPKRNYSRPQSAFEPFELRTPGDPASGFKLN